MQTMWSPEALVSVLKDTFVSLVAADRPDLSARQMAIFLNCYLEPDGEHTVRGLAEIMRVSKPAVTRGLDRLEELGLAKRVLDQSDRRSILVKPTVSGDSFLRDLKGLLSAAVSAVPTDKKVAA